MLERTQIEKPKRSTSIQILLGLIANFSSLAPSMSLGFSAIALPTLTAIDNPNRLDASQSSWFASIAAIATPIGCLMSGPISDRYGRKTAILWVNAVCFFGWAAICVAHSMPQAYQYEMLLLGRVITGISTGLSSMPANVYMAEISSTKLRGMFTTWSAISFSLGVLIIYILGFILKDNWGTTALATSVFPCIGMFLILVFMPESPPWLIAQGRLDEAKSSMCQIFGTKEYRHDVETAIDTLLDAKRSGRFDRNRVTYREFLQPTCVRPFILILAYFFFQQFSGVFVVVFYAVDIVRELNVTLDPYLAAVLIAATRMCAAVIVSFLSKKYGRRSLSIVSGSGMTLCMLLLSGYLVFLNVPRYSWMPIALLMLYFFASTLGFLTMPFAMAAEVFPARIRGMITGIITCLAYIFNFMIVKAYPQMLTTLGTYKLFLFYGTMGLLGTIFCIVFLPETKGKTLQEIEAYFGRKKERAKELEVFVQEKTNV